MGRSVGASPGGDERPYTPGPVQQPKATGVVPAGGSFVLLPSVLTSARCHHAVTEDGLRETRGCVSPTLPQALVTPAAGFLESSLCACFQRGSRWLLAQPLARRGGSWPACWA